MDKSELVEKYLLNQMTPSERMAFEDRLKTDRSLADEVDLNKKIIDGIRQYADEERIVSSFKEQYDGEQTQARVRRLVFIRIAAVALLLIASTWLLVFYFGSKKAPGEKYISKQEKKLQPTHPVSPSTKDSTNKNLIAANNKLDNFSELARFEALINQEYRSEEGFEVISPKNTQKYKAGDPIVFRWQRQGTDQLNLVIFSNKGKVVSEQKIPSSFSYKKILIPGLYYWQLETEEDAVFMGKFIVQQPVSNAK
jgi:hypothetical protein